MDQIARAPEIGASIKDKLAVWSVATLGLAVVSRSSNSAFASPRFAWKNDGFCSVERTYEYP